VTRLLARHDERVRMLRAWAEHDAEAFRRFVATIEACGGALYGGRVLDLGCGANAPMTLLLHALGARVTGVDDEVGERWGLGFHPARYARYLRRAGAARTLRKAVGELVYDRRYYRALAAATGLALTERGLDLRVMRLERLDLPAASFDVVHSNATWEHVADVSAANRELARVLRPGGLAYIEIHLFPSLSGGHDLPWIVPGRVVLDGVMPWRHLRDPQWKAPVRLNRLRERDYRRAFDATPEMEIVRWETEFREGEDLLTDELLEQMADYSADELTKRSIIVVVRRTGALQEPGGSQGE
jgi:SAM-dependent methyltransferase